MALSPSPQLLIPGGGANTSRRFALSSRGWFDMQIRLQSLLALPGSLGDYERRYGSVASGPRMRECFAAMGKLRDVAMQYGNSRQLRSNIQQTPSLFAVSERPANDVYAAAIWTLERLRCDAAAMASALISLPAIARRTPARQAVADIQGLFADAGGLADRMQQTVIRLNTLLNELQVLLDELENAQAIMRIYTDSKSATQRALNHDIAAWQTPISELERERASAYARWLGLTISGRQIPAVIRHVGPGPMILLTVPSGEASFAVAGGVAPSACGIAIAGMGTAAALARGAYDDLISQIGALPDPVQTRVAFRHDLGALDSAMRASLPAASDMIDQLTLVRDAWANSLREIKYRLGELDAATVTTGPWLREAEMTASAAHWTQLADAISAFAGGSLVDSGMLPFGGALPKDDPDWQQTLLRKIAA